MQAATPEIPLWPFQGWPLPGQAAYGRLTIPLETPCRTPLYKFIPTQIYSYHGGNRRRFSWTKESVEVGGGQGGQAVPGGQAIAGGEEGVGDVTPGGEGRRRERRLKGGLEDQVKDEGVIW
jgi:hypothetical protein